MNKVPAKTKTVRGSTKEELMNLDKNDLVEKILQLEAHNLQLKNIISKNASTDIKDGKNNNKLFDFTKCHFRRVLLRIMYFGWDYQGLAVQEDTTQTIEHHLFQALMKACLIQSRETSQYHRCGRTDKGVSAFGQVISICLRSKHELSQQSDESAISTEMPYCKILNRLLPKHIRALAWMPIPDDKPDYSARFDCKRRLYKYYFPRSSLDVAAMRAACARALGAHDFRHLCKMDVGNGVTEFRREVHSADILPMDENDAERPTSMYCLMIEGNAFLWHQIRCIMGVLLLIGQKREEPGVMTELLDVETNLRKPQYNMALDIPLNLFRCSYDLEQKNKWVYDKDELRSTIKHLQAEWTVYSVKKTMIKDSLEQLEAVYANMSRESETAYNESSACDRDSIMSHTDCLLQGVKSKVYTPLMKRQTCSSLEERIEYYRKKRKVDEDKDLDKEHVK